MHRKTDGRNQQKLHVYTPLADFCIGGGGGGGIINEDVPNFPVTAESQYIKKKKKKKKKISDTHSVLLK